MVINGNEWSTLNGNEWSTLNAYTHGTRDPWWHNSSVRRVLGNKQTDSCFAVYQRAGLDVRVSLDAKKLLLLLLW